MCETEIDTTYEGDNTVLCQQVTAFLMSEFRMQMSLKKPFSGLLAYLNTFSSPDPSKWISFSNSKMPYHASFSMTGARVCP